MTILRKELCCPGAMTRIWGLQTRYKLPCHSTSTGITRFDLIGKLTYIRQLTFMNSMTFKHSSLSSLKPINTNSKTRNRKVESALYCALAEFASVIICSKSSSAVEHFNSAGMQRACHWWFCSLKNHLTRSYCQTYEIKKACSMLIAHAKAGNFQFE